MGSLVLLRQLSEYDEGAEVAPLGGEGEPVLRPRVRLVEGELHRVLQHLHQQPEHDSDLFI